MFKIYFQDYGDDQKVYNTWDEWGLVVEDVQIGFPRLKNSVLDDAGYNGRVVVETNEWGVKTWGNRTISIVLSGVWDNLSGLPIIDADRKITAIDRFAEYMTHYEYYGDQSTAYFKRCNGKKKIWIPMDLQAGKPADYYRGVCSITNMQDAGGKWQINLTIDADPFRIRGDYEITTTGIVENPAAQGQNNIPVELYVRDESGQIPKVDIYGPNGNIIVADFQPKHHKFYVPELFAPDTDKKLVEIKGGSGTYKVSWEVGCL